MRDWENQASGRFCTYHKSALFISKLKSIIVCAGSAAAGDPIRKVSNLPTIADFGEKQKSEVKSVYNPQKQQEKQASEGPQPEESWCCWMEIVVCGGKRVWHKFRGSSSSGLYFAAGISPRAPRSCGGEARPDCCSIIIINRPALELRKK